MILVKFHKPSSPYFPPDIAGFAKAVAARYVETGYADYCDAQGKVIAAAAEPARDLLDAGKPAKSRKG